MPDQSPSTLSRSESRLRWRPQMSLAMLLTLFVTVALAIAYVMLLEKYSRLEADFQKVKKDFRVLEVTDPNLVHAIGFNGVMKGIYRFRFYIPHDKKFVLRYVFGPVPKTGYDVQLTNNHIYGQYELRSEVFKERNHEVMLQSDSRNIVLSYPDDTRFFPRNINHPEGASGQVTTGGIVTTQRMESAQPGQRLELMRQHSRHTSWDPKTKQYSPDIHDGILLWIEEVPNVKPAGKSDGSAKM